MKNYEIIDTIARELGYNRFCGTIAAKNSSQKLNNLEECELADVLASNNLTLFREDALLLIKKIFSEDSTKTEVKELLKYVDEELEYLGKTSASNPDKIEEITNPILSLEI